MAKYILADILRVRKLRQNAAEKALKEAKDLVKEAEVWLGKTEDKLAQYKIYIIKATEEAYNKVIKRKIKRGAVDELHYELQIFKNTLRDHEKNVENAKINLEKAQQNCEEKRHILDIANKNIEKLNSHKDSWMAEATKLEELAEDKELEEFTGKSIKKQ